MNRSDALRVLARAKPELAKRFGVIRLVLFGSTAWNLELLGEAASHIPAEIRESVFEIPWR